MTDDEPRFRVRTLSDAALNERLGLTPGGRLEITDQTSEMRRLPLRLQVPVVPSNTSPTLFHEGAD